jgi:hypothetical protein
MSETPPQTPKQVLEDVQAACDLFARAHDYIAQATHPGHMGIKVGEVLNFLKFQYEALKLRAENMAKQIEAEAKAELSKVDMQAAALATEAVLKAETPQETPKA